MQSTPPQLTRETVLDGRAVAELLHLPISTVLEYARRGVIPAHKLGRRWIFIRDEIDAAVRGAPARPPTTAKRGKPESSRRPVLVAQPSLPFDATG
ncbi:MAG: helix-turn-helix domain-containing protein [Solirubrobacteraceae bacterium]